MTHSYRDTLRRRGLLPFLWTQFLGAFNDNLFKFVVTLVAAGAAVGADADRAVSIAGMVFVAPFLLFSGYAGQLADTYSKRTVLVVTKSLEIVATGLALIAFATNHLQLLFVTLFLISMQATFFSPAKYGILPELLPEGDLSRANGLLEMSTFVAIVAGAAVGSGPDVNLVKGGSTVPLQFNVYESGVEKTDTAGLQFRLTSVPCEGGSETPVVFETTGGTTLRYAGEAFIQNWKTPATPGVCYVVRMTTTADGLSLSALFTMK